ncbi:uncharacterized protein LOC135131601 [Zophobas morio]|uniref:uncharacterized protein LOC135131601 n=1 Tax=Zophobas morio TaxID=2755281 RepID=UPI0030832BDB
MSGQVTEQTVTTKRQHEMRMAKYRDCLAQNLKNWEKRKRVSRKKRVNTSQLETMGPSTSAQNAESNSEENWFCKLCDFKADTRQCIICFIWVHEDSVGLPPKTRMNFLVDTLPIPKMMRTVVQDAMSKWNLQLFPPGEAPIQIPVRRGVYQGDSLSPMLFVLVTASIIKRIKEDPQIARLSLGKHLIVAYMDDIKCHAPNNRSTRAIMAMLEESARALGLELNLGKCGHYCRLQKADEEGGDDDDLIPAVKNGYKYLGLIQTERDSPENFNILEEKILAKAEEILSSNLTTAQKRRIFNSCVIPAAVYVTGNIMPNSSVQGTLRACRALDLKIRKHMVAENIKTLPTSNQRAYLPHSIGGLGFRSIETETEIQYARRYAYLTCHPELTDILEQYKTLDAARCRTPLSDFRHIAEKYNLEIPVEENWRDLATRLVEGIRAANLEVRMQDWGKALQYPRLVLRERDSISFPAAEYFRTNSSKLSMINAAAEEQITQFRATPGRRLAEDRRCRRGCPAEETAYHVVTSCRTTSYTTRHDQAVYWLLRTLLEALSAPDEVRRRLQFGRAMLNAEFDAPLGPVRIRAGQAILTGVPLHHNKPDVMVQVLARVPSTYIFEVSIPHLQNYRTQEGIKRTKYGRNSVAEKLPDHRTGSQPWVGYGEVLDTDERRRFARLPGSLGVKDCEVKALYQKAAYSVITETTKILCRHMGR